MDKNKLIVVGFPSWDYTPSFLKSLSDHEKHEYALEDNDAVIYDCVDDYFSNLNNDFVDTENMYWFCISIG